MRAAILGNRRGIQIREADRRKTPDLFFFSLISCQSRTISQMLRNWVIQFKYIGYLETQIRAESGPSVYTCVIRKLEIFSTDP